MNYKILSFVVFSIFLLSMASAMTVYADFDDGSRSTTITEDESIAFNVDFFSMNTPMTIKAQLYQGSNLIHTFLNTNTNAKTYYNTYTYTINTAGTYEIRVIGTDKVNTDSEYLTLIVNPVSSSNNPPAIQSIPNQNIEEGDDYTYQVNADDIDGDALTYLLIDNSPNWLDIDSDGLITGTAPSNLNQNTPFTVTVQVSDGEDIDTDSYILTVLNTINPTNDAPVITSSPVTSVTEGNSYHYHVHATDSDGPDQLTYDLLEAPDWLDINEDTGEIEGTAPFVSSSTNYDIQVRAFDGADYSITQHYILRVKNIASSAGGGGSRSISDSDIYYQNKYFDQFNKDIALYTKPKTQNLFGLTALTFFYFLIAIISLGIIIVVFLLGRNLRR